MRGKRALSRIGDGTLYGKDTKEIWCDLKCHNGNISVFPVDEKPERKIHARSVEAPTSSACVAILVIGARTNTNTPRHDLVQA